MITITIGARLEVAGEIPGSLRRVLIQDNTFQNPRHEMLERMGKWADGEPRTIELWSEEDDRLTFPRGFFPALIGRIRGEAKTQRRGLEYTVQDATICPRLRDSIKPRGELFPYQVSALEKLLQHSTGTLEAPTGSGKTNILLSAAAQLQTFALILVHTTELFDQTSARARSWLGVEPGVIAGPKSILAPITVAMVQTLSRRDLQAQGIADYFGAVLVDECHHSPATTWAAILDQLPAKYRYGFTATAWRKDKLQFLIWRMIGNISAAIPREEVEAAGRLVWPDIEVVNTDYCYAIDDASEWGAMISDLVRDEDRNALIEHDVRSRLTPEIRALVLTDRIEHAKHLARRLGDLHPVLLTGEICKPDRARAMDGVRAGAPLTIATTSLLGEGVDVPGWNLLFLASPIAGGPRVLQVVGRVARPAPDKTQALVVDFVDSNVWMLAAAFNKRRQLYATGA